MQNFEWAFSANYLSSVQNNGGFGGMSKKISFKGVNGRLPSQLMNILAYYDPGKR